MNLKRGLSKGIFWFTCNYLTSGDDEVTCDFTDTQLIYRDILCNSDGDFDISSVKLNSRYGNSLTHRSLWKDLTKNNRELHKHAWNYYPRGRVEITKSKAQIYLNPIILCYDKFLDDIVRVFGLDMLSKNNISYRSDNSAHYACYANNRMIKP